MIDPPRRYQEITIQESYVSMQTSDPEAEFVMRKIFKAVHMLGLSLFLGSIAVYIALSTQPWAPGTPAFAQLRDQISLATRCLTLPGLLATLASGVGLLWMTRKQLQRWQKAKAIVGLLLLFNTWLIVAPAVQSAAHLSASAVFSNGKANELGSALKIETVAGAVNVMLACLEIWLAVFRPALRVKHRVGPVSTYAAAAGRNAGFDRYGA